jgi:hypothetical protein
MTTILARFSVVNFCGLLAAFLVGLISKLTGGPSDQQNPLPTYHFYLGLFSVLSTLGVHCLIFIYFLGTGRWVKEVALAYGIPDRPLPKLTRELKRRTFPVALLAMLVPIAAAATGTGALRKEWAWEYHALTALATLLVNAWAFVVEYRNVGINAGIIDDVMREVDRIRAESGLPSNEEALRQESEKMTG